MGISLQSTERNSPISKIEALNRRLITIGEKISGKEIRKMVKEIFNIDLEAISQIGEGTQQLLYPEFIKMGLVNAWHMQEDTSEFNNRLVATPKDSSMDDYIKLNEKAISPEEIYQVINGIYGVNLQGISSIEHARIALFSKGQWIVKSENDLLTVETGLGDVDIKVYPTKYFIEKTGSTLLPDELHKDLINFGFSYNPQMKAYYYENPLGGSIPSTIKDQVMGAVIKCAQQNSNI